MSSARRYQEDIRRIVGLQENGTGIEDDLPRMRIGAGRGVYQIGTEEVKSGSGTGEENKDGDTEDPVMPDEDEDNANEDGSGSGNSNTDPDGTTNGDGSGNNGSDTGTEQIDPDNPPPGSYAPGGSDTFGSNWSTGGPKGFVDCETNQCVELVETGGYVPPEGWDSADDPPIDQFYEKGYYWENNTGFYINVSVIGLSPAQVYAGLPQSTTNPTGNIRTKNRLVTGNPTSATAFYCVDGLCGGDEVAIMITRKVCPPDGSVSVCGNDVPPPRPEYWPSDNCIQLAPNSDGNWQASNRESPDDMTAKYSEPKSTMQLCTPSGEVVDIYQRVGGGHVYFNNDQGIWAGTDSSGRVRSFGSSSTYDQEVVRPRN